MNEASVPAETISGGTSQSQIETADQVASVPDIPDVPEVESIPVVAAPTPPPEPPVPAVEASTVPAVEPIKPKRRTPKAKKAKAPPKKRIRLVSADDIQRVIHALQSKGDQPVLSKNIADALEGYPKRRAQVTTKAALKVLVHKGWAEEMVRGFYRITPKGQIVSG